MNGSRRGRGPIRNATGFCGPGPDDPSEAVDVGGTEPVAPGTISAPCHNVRDAGSR